MVILTLAKSPFFLVLVFLILIKTALCLVQIIFKSTRLGYKANGSLGLVTRKFPNLFDVAEVSTWDELDFLLNRSFAYVRTGFSTGKDRKYIKSKHVDLLKKPVQDACLQQRFRVILDFGQMI